MSISPALFSTAREREGTTQKDHWATPPAIYDPLNAIFGFTLDVAAEPETAKCARYFSEEEDGLAQPWAGETCWLNPPYSTPLLRAFMAKAHAESAQALVCCLIAARTDTQIWHDHARHGDLVFIKGRIAFVGGLYTAPFPSALVIFRPELAAGLRRPAVYYWDWRAEEAPAGLGA